MFKKGEDAVLRGFPEALLEKLTEQAESTEKIELPQEVVAWLRTTIERKYPDHDDQTAITLAAMGRKIAIINSLDDIEIITPDNIDEKLRESTKEMYGEESKQ